MTYQGLKALISNTNIAYDHSSNGFLANKRKLTGDEKKRSNFMIGLRSHTWLSYNPRSFSTEEKMKYASPLDLFNMVEDVSSFSIDKPHNLVTRDQLTDLVFAYAKKQNVSVKKTGETLTLTFGKTTYTLFTHVSDDIFGGMGVTLSKL